MAYNKRSWKALFLILVLSFCIMLSQTAIAQETQAKEDSAASNAADTANESSVIISEEKQLSRLSPAYVNELKEKRQLITNLILIAAALILIYLIYRYKIKPHLGHKEHVKGHSEFFGR